MTLRHHERMASISEPDDEPAPTLLADVGSRVDHTMELAEAAANTLVTAKPGHIRAATLALWHVRGLAYHVRNLFSAYEVIASEVGSRVLAAGGPDGPGPEMVIMHSPQAQEILFEFYALVTLARISLDALRDLLLPLFAPSEQTLPNSITDVLKGSTDCPIYRQIAREPVFRYLVDVRDCLVHHKTLAAGDVLVGIREGVALVELEQSVPAAWSSDPVIKALYRRVSGAGVALNLLLPDHIYELASEGGRGRLIKPFSYDLGINVLTQSVEFLRFVTFQVVSGFVALRDAEGPLFEWRKTGPRRRA